MRLIQLYVRRLALLRHLRMIARCYVPLEANVTLFHLLHALVVTVFLYCYAGVERLQWD